MLQPPRLCMPLSLGCGSSDGGARVSSRKNVGICVGIPPLWTCRVAWDSRARELG
jgi:hypothetical protein